VRSKRIVENHIIRKTIDIEGALLAIQKLKSIASSKWSNAWLLNIRSWVDHIFPFLYCVSFFLWEAIFPCPCWSL